MRKGAEGAKSMKKKRDGRCFFAESSRVGGCAEAVAIEITRKGSGRMPCGDLCFGASERSGARIEAGGRRAFARSLRARFRRSFANCGIGATVRLGTVVQSVPSRTVRARAQRRADAEATKRTLKSPERREPRPSELPEPASRSCASAPSLRSGSYGTVSNIPKPDPGRGKGGSCRWRFKPACG